jgi:hypothetical protein
VAFLSQCLADVTDEVIERFDHRLAEAYARAGHDLEAFRMAMAQATNEKVHLFRELARTVLDPAIADSHLRSTSYQRVPPTVLQRAAEESDRIVRPLDDSYFDLFEARYGYLRQCTPAFRRPSSCTPISLRIPCWRPCSCYTNSTPLTGVLCPRRPRRTPCP